ALEARKIGQCAQHGFLQYILGRGGVAHQPAGEIVRGVEIRQHDRLEGVAWRRIQHVTNPPDPPMLQREPPPSQAEIAIAADLFPARKISRPSASYATAAPPDGQIS